MILLKTRLGRYFLIAIAIGVALIIVNPDVLSPAAPRKSVGRSHRPPVSARAGDFIKLTLNFSAANKPKAITWAINGAIHPVDVSLLPPNNPQYQQVFPYDPTAQYEISATGQYPLNCIISIDALPVDNDALPPRARGREVNIGTVHCWVGAS